MDESSDVPESLAPPRSTVHRPITRLPTAAGEALERTLLEVDTAIALVVAGIAVTVALYGFEAGDGVAFTAAVWAQAAGVAFRLRSEGGSISLLVGPRFGPGSAPPGFETES